MCEGIFRNCVDGNLNVTHIAIQASREVVRNNIFLGWGRVGLNIGGNLTEVNKIIFTSFFTLVKNHLVISLALGSNGY